MVLQAFYVELYHTFFARPIKKDLVTFRKNEDHVSKSTFYELNDRKLKITIQSFKILSPLAILLE